MYSKCSFGVGTRLGNGRLGFNWRQGQIIFSPVWSLYLSCDPFALVSSGYWGNYPQG
jgi:hypothetical protein